MAKCELIWATSEWARRDSLVTEWCKTQGLIIPPPLRRRADQCWWIKRKRTVWWPFFLSCFQIQIKDPFCLSSEGRGNTQVHCLVYYYLQVWLFLCSLPNDQRDVNHAVDLLLEQQQQQPLPRGRQDDVSSSPSLDSAAAPSAEVLFLCTSPVKHCAKHPTELCVLPCVGPFWNDISGASFHRFPACKYSSHFQLDAPSLFYCIILSAKALEPTVTMPRPIWLTQTSLSLSLSLTHYHTT